jgi:hypothetical protein
MLLEVVFTKYIKFKFKSVRLRMDHNELPVEITLCRKSGTGEKIDSYNAQVDAHRGAQVDVCVWKGIAVNEREKATAALY